MVETNRNALPAGQSLGGYEIEAVLGSGGFGITYKARESIIGRIVAIKEYLPSDIAVRDRESSSIQPTDPRNVDDYDWGLSRFRQEAQTLVTFRHPNIVAVLHYFEANNTAYLVMEYEGGDDLGTLLKRAGPLSETELRRIVVPLLDGLARVHAAGFLHRDIKPENIYVRDDGTPVLLDFGAARQAMGARSHPMTNIVSMGYAPFEQYVSDSKQGPWSDIYALGAVLYHVVTGRRPVEATARVRADAIVPAMEAGRGRYSAAFLRAIDSALAVREEDRPQSVEAFLAMIDPSVVETVRSPGLPAESWAPTEDEVKQVTRHLAEAIGPIASVQVRRIAPRVRDLQQLYQRLSEKIENIEDRERFLDKLRKLG
ncbi:MAG: serine/threonine-protein kinase [Arenicellales bacterium]